MRSFDGAMVRYGPPDWNFTAMYGVPPPRGLRARRNGRNSESGRHLYCVERHVCAPLGLLLGRTFFIWYGDNRRLTPADNEPTKQASANHRAISVESAGTDLMATSRLGRGTADILMWALYEFGDWGRQSQRAWRALACFSPATSSAVRWSRRVSLQAAGKHSVTLKAFCRSEEFRERLIPCQRVLQSPP